jgi:hypothetical protein
MNRSRNPVPGIGNACGVATITNARKVDMTPFGPQSQAAAWRKSSFCQNGECAEITQQGGEMMLRSTRSPGDVIRLTAAEWRALVKGIEAGEFRDVG